MASKKFSFNGLNNAAISCQIKQIKLWGFSDAEAFKTVCSLIMLLTLHFYGAMILFLCILCVFGLGYKMLHNHLISFKSTVDTL